MIDSQAFNQQITQADTPLAKTYLFYGQTPFLSEENTQILIETAKKQGFNRREIFYIDNRFKFQPLLDSLNSPGLFDPKKILELRFDTDKPTKKIGEQIAKIAAHQSANLIIIQASGINYRSQKEKWFTDTVKHSVAVVSKPIYANQLPNWIHQRATHLGIKLSADAVKWITRFSEGNLLWTNQILMQLTHSDYPQPISGEVIQEMLADMSVFQIEDLNRALLNKDKNALKIIEKLEQENESLVYITTVLYKEFDTINQVIHSGQPFTQACRTLKIWQNKQRNYQAAINHYDPKKITDTLRQLALLDKINKGQHKGDGWLLLNRLTTNLLV